MAISRMQEPRQLYGLGSLVKSIGKGVKKFVKSPLGKAAILGIGAFGVPGTTFGGLFGRAAIGGEATGLLGKTGIQAVLPSLFGTSGESKLGTGGKLGLGAGFITYLMSTGATEEDVESLKRDKNKLSIYLKDYFTSLNPNASDKEIEEFVQTNISEYATGGRVGLNKGAVPFPEEEFKKFLQEKGEQQEMQNQNRLMQEFLQYLKRNKPIAVKDGGRIGLKDGPPKYMFNEVLREPMSDLERASVGNPGTKEMYRSEILKMLAENRDEAKTKIPMKSKEQQPFKPDIDKLKELIKKKKKGLAAGGMPTGIMRTNKAGVLERDYRDEGGFVPVGIKERADDVPAMLSKNEFVMTADAVRGAGDGSIEKGAQRMYDQMKRLENKVA
mgnify:CR=1 FL=1